ncbi:hypothetical protein [Rhizobium oryziradicis]|nr:hypothetical protein [Rhizobium oryziradicis]
MAWLPETEFFINEGCRLGKPPFKTWVMVYSSDLTGALNIPFGWVSIQK